MDILQPVAVLVLWSLVVLGWAATTRLSTMGKLKMGPETGKRTRELGDKLPPEVQCRMDNYNHLMEQPTIFYATAIALAVLGLGTGLNLMFAWAYAGLRIVHSLVQGTSNAVPVRFPIFALATVCQLALAIHLAMAVFW